MRPVTEPNCDYACISPEEAKLRTGSCHGN